jgi:hypothetical protein
MAGQKITTRKAYALLGGLLTLAFHHFSQCVTIIIVLIIILTGSKEGWKIDFWYANGCRCSGRVISGFGGILLYTLTFCYNKIDR